MNFPEDWPIYYPRLLSIGNPKAGVSLVTLWTKKDFFTDKLDTNLYSVAGQLYSKNGINFMIRNILAFPSIRKLVVCGAELSGSGAELVKFWETGESDVIEKEIPKEALDELRNNVELVNLVGVNDVEKVKQALTECNTVTDMFRDIETYPEAEIMGPDQYPSDVSAYKIRGKKIVDVWAKLQSTIMRFGEKKDTDGYQIRECLNTVAIIEDEDPENHHIPDWFIFNDDEINDYVDKFQDGNFNPKQSYTYGNRMRQYFKKDQIQWIKDRLKDDPNAREAVASLVDPVNDLHFDASRPCVTFVQAIKQRDKIHLNIYVRSHDMYAGWPQNAFGFLHLQDEICKEVGMERGVLTIISASAHIYDYNWDASNEVAEKYFRAKMPCEVDPYGNFIIEVDRENQELLVHHQTPSGLPVQTFKGKNSEDIIMAITRAQAISIPQHAMDLGRQLYKAELALTHDVEFIQDRPLDLGLLPEEHEYFVGQH